MKTWIIFFLFFLCIHKSNAQNEFDAIDKSVAQLGSLAGLNVATIADTLAQLAADKKNKLRAFYYWIAHNIGCDLKAAKSNDTKNNAPELVVSNRKASPAGLALLFQEMASQANIRCLAVDGYIRRSTDDINNPIDESNHSWNVVQLGQSNTEWFYVDVALGSGFTDKSYKTYTPLFTSEYFFADRTLFNLDHFADNPAWQLGNTGAKTKNDFYRLPVIGSAAYSLGFTKLLPEVGYVKAKMNKAITFTFHKSKPCVINQMTIVCGDERRALPPVSMAFTNGDYLLSCNYTFKKDDTFPVRIFADGKLLTAYVVEVLE